MSVAIGVLVMLVAGASFIGFSGADRDLRIGDRVFAEWSLKVWYPGVIQKTCEKGFTVLYDDGDTRCVSTGEMIRDTLPKKETVRVGAEVIAQWEKGPYYDATIIAITDDTYKIQYYTKETAWKKLSEMRVTK
mgnify:CR=1 FL=1